MTSVPQTLKLNNDVKMPTLGLGVWHIENSKAKDAVSFALKSGYRYIDTARVYYNEEGVGKGIKESGIPRKEIFVTTKLGINDIFLKRPEKAFEESLKRLNLDYVDLYLIHWPMLFWDKAWTKGLEKIYASGQARSIGVSNFDISHLKKLKKISKITPMVNQVEISPFLRRKKLVEYCKSEGIVVTAYSPLTHGMRINAKEITEIATKYNKTNTQIMIRWGLQHGLVEIPKAEKEEHIKENLEVFDFEISEEDMRTLDLLDTNSSVFPLWSRG